MQPFATLARPRVLLAGYLLVRLALAGALIVVFGVEGMVDLLAKPEWVAMTLAVPTLAGLVGISVRVDRPRR